ncbi:MAG: hypothetical protein GEU26_12635 [Nitrososphaeraceae archaeon]|nr:hypothetical protein [Nitrososphaeraceae archaeon]
MQGLNRQETEDYVIDLYYNQKKTIREIQKIVRKSPRDLSFILNKVEPERSSLSESSRAYRLFKDRRNLIDVATLLNLREKEVTEYYREFWNLNGMYALNQIYEEIKAEGILSIVGLHRRMKEECLSPQQFTRILKRIITLERQNIDLEGEQARLEVSNKQATKTFQQFTDLAQKDRKTMEENFSIISQQRREIENLNIEKARLENSIDSIWLNNETCVKINHIVKHEIESIISNPRWMLRLALASLFESSRKHPGKFQTLYYNTLSHLSVEQILSESSDSQDASLYGFGENEHEKLLLDEAEQSYNRIVDAITNNCINGMPNNTESLSPISHVPDVQGIGGSSKIFDTRDLSQVNFVYNNITFQLSPGRPKITNESNSGTDVMPGEDESDTYSSLQEQQE